MATHTPTGHQRPRDGPAPLHFGSAPNVIVPRTCPGCGRESHWKLFQVVGETPGIPGMPAQGSGVVFRCGLCSCTERYRERPATDAERAERLAILSRGVKP